MQASGNVVSSEHVHNIFFSREDVVGRRAAAQGASQWERRKL